MLTLAGSEDSSCFKFIGMGNSASNNSVNLITENTSLLSNSTSILFSANNYGMDTCSFYSEPIDSTIFAFGESSNFYDSVQYSGSSESCGSIAFSGSSESCGSIASSSFSSSSFSGGCSYSC